MTPVRREALKEITRRLPRLPQRAARRLDIIGLEQLYQRNYLSLAEQTPWLDRIPLASVRGGAANYSLLYALLTALHDTRVENVLEIGVGISSGLITQWVAASGGSSVHVEHDAGWLSRSIPEMDRVTAVRSDLQSVNVAGRSIDWYDHPPLAERFNLVLVDGPPAWKKRTRYNRLGFLDWVPEVLADEFIIIIDDSSRQGESSLARLCVERLRRESVQVSVSQVTGADSQAIIATPGFQGMLYL